MTGYAFDPPLQLCTDPEWAILSLDQAAQVVRAHLLAHAGPDAARLLQRIDRAVTREQKEILCNESREWAERNRLVSTPPIGA